MGRRIIRGVSSYEYLLGCTDDFGREGPLSLVDLVLGKGSGVWHYADYATGLCLAMAKLVDVALLP